MHSNEKVVFLGLDPGYDRCGVAVLEKNVHGEQVLYSGCIETDRTDEFELRLKQVYEEIGALIATYTPTVFALETLFLTKNQKTAMRVAEVRGVLLLLAALNKLTVVQFSPPQVKRAICGDGSADKRQIIRMVPQIVSLPHTPTHDDEYDAVAVALTASAIYRQTRTM